MTIDIETLREPNRLQTLDEPARFELANAVEQTFPRGATMTVLTVYPMVVMWRGRRAADEAL